MGRFKHAPLVASFDAFIRISAKDQTGRDITSAKQKISAQISSLQGAVSAGLAAIGGSAILGSSLGLAAAAEQSRIAFDTILKDGAKTKALLEELNKFSVSTPFTAREVQQAGQALLQFQTAAEDIPDTLKFLGDAAAGGGGDFTELVRIFNKVKSTGRLTAETFEQFAERGVNLRVELGRMLGKTGEEIVEMQRKGEISFDLVVAAFKNMTGEGGIFFNAMEKQSKSFTGLMSTFKSNVDAIRRGIGEQLLPIGKALLKQAIAMTDGFQAVDKAMGGALSKILAFAGAIVTAAAAITPLIIALRAIGVKELLASLVQIAPIAAKIAIRFFPIIAIVVAIVAGLVAVINWLRKIPAVQAAWRDGIDKLILAWENMREAVGNVWEGLRALLNFIIGTFNRMFGTTIQNIQDSFIGMIVRMLDAVSEFVIDATELLLAMQRNWNLIFEDIARAIQAIMNFQLPPPSEFLEAVMKTKEELEAERKKRLEDMRKAREEARAETEAEAAEAGAGFSIPTARVKVELPKGLFGIGDLTRQFQQAELKALSAAKKTEINTARTAVATRRTAELLESGGPRIARVATESGPA